MGSSHEEEMKAFFGDALRIENKILYPMIEVTVTEDKGDFLGPSRFVSATISPLAILVVESHTKKKEERVQYVVPLIESQIHNNERERMSREMRDREKK